MYFNLIALCTARDSRPHAHVYRLSAEGQGQCDNGFTTYPNNRLIRAQTAIKTEVVPRIRIGPLHFLVQRVAVGVSKGTRTMQKCSLKETYNGEQLLYIQSMNSQF